MSQDLGAVGRVREGRVDTGEPIFRDEKGVRAELVRRALTNNGFGLDDAHWFTQKREGRKTKFVVSLAYSASDAEIPPMKRETQEALRELAATGWICHVWLNPNGVLTINFVNIIDHPDKQLTVRDGILFIDREDGAVVAQGCSVRGVKTVLVKFFFTNPRRIPKGILQVERPSNTEMDRRHAEAMKPKPAEPVDVSTDDLDILEASDGTLVGGE